jgi:hypothetical protein
VRISDHITYNLYFLFPDITFSFKEVELLRDTSSQVLALVGRGVRCQLRFAFLGSKVPALCVLGVV